MDIRRVPVERAVDTTPRWPGPPVQTWDVASPTATTSEAGTTLATSCSVTTGQAATIEATSPTLRAPPAPSAPLPSPSVTTNSAPHRSLGYYLVTFPGDLCSG